MFALMYIKYIMKTQKHVLNVVKVNILIPKIMNVLVNVLRILKKMKQIKFVTIAKNLVCFS